jgi:excisionase family DNA binding protein
MIENLNNEKENNEMQTQNSIFDGELLTMAEAAAILKITRKALYDWKRKGKIRTVKVAGSLVRVPAADLAALITR